jgi:hypothetical protein
LHSVLRHVLNGRTEDRSYVGFDSRYRIGNLSIEPTFSSSTSARCQERVIPVTVHTTAGSLFRTARATMVTPY